MGEMSPTQIRGRSVLCLVLATFVTLIQQRTEHVCMGLVLWPAFGWLYALCRQQGILSISKTVTSTIADFVQLTPLDYLNAIYAEWIPLGLWIMVLPFLPETPWFYARTSQVDKAKKVMAKLYKDVPGYDVEYEYGVMCDRLAEETAKGKDNAAVRWVDIIKGTDLVSYFDALL